MIGVEALVHNGIELLPFATEIGLTSCRGYLFQANHVQTDHARPFPCAVLAAGVKSAPSPLIVVADVQPGAIAGLSGDGFR
ncbi:hypothetical protein [Bradyrhizobium erythrophlei]|uniref:hypothetical protein n=1 Tax=Bradyrhizobium erythrophlei TaxID=1437360 RepID=UPI0015613378|nr:hypothetical protein [Bradyrhizobium erythrophlei]